MVEEPPSDILIAVVAIRSMRTTLDFDNLVMTIPEGDGVVTVGLETDPSRAQYFGSATDSGEFTSDPDGRSSSSTYEESMHVLEIEGVPEVPEAAIEASSPSAAAVEEGDPGNADMLRVKLGHLGPEAQDKITRLLKDSGTIAWSPDDLRPATTSVSHKFELEDPLRYFIVRGA